MEYFFVSACSEWKSIVKYYYSKSRGDENVTDSAKNNSSSKFNRHIRKKRVRKGIIIVVILLTVVFSVLVTAGVLSFRFLTAKPESSEKSVVPELSGVEISQAQAILEEKGLAMRIIGSGAGIGDENTVVWQSVQSGEKIADNAVVDVWVQRAAGESWKWTDSEYTLQELSDSDIFCSVVYSSDSGVSDGIVTDVEVSGSDAVVYVNKTEIIAMPDVKGMTEADAAKLLDGLGIAYVKNVIASDEEKGTVLGQYPLPDESVGKGDTVLLTVCAGKIKSPVFSLAAEGETERSLTVGQSIFLEAAITPDSAALNIIEWSSSDGEVVIAEPTGRITAVGEGSATVTASCENGEFSVEYMINVSDVIVGVEIIEMPNTQWLTGDEFSAEGLLVEARTIGGKTRDITDDCKISEVDLTEEGSKNITVKYSQGQRTVCAGFDIVCCEPSLEIDVSSVILGLDDRHTIHPTSSPSYAKVTYSSSDERIAKVSEDGVITGIKAGKCVITAEIDGKISRQCSVDVKKKIAYLTLDDGPNSYTDNILACLKKHDVKATFFCVGNSRYKKVYTMIAEEGHALGLHSYSHTYSKCYASADAFMKETKKLQNMIYDCTGQRPMIVRFPGGTGNTVAERDVMLEIVKRLHAEGFEYYDWNCHSNDTIKNISAAEAARRVLGSCHDDTEFILMHNLDITCDALDIVIPALKRRGYTFKTVTIDTPPIQSKVRGKGH